MCEAPSVEAFYLNYSLDLEVNVDFMTEVVKSTTKMDHHLYQFLELMVTWGQLELSSAVIGRRRGSR